MKIERSTNNDVAIFIVLSVILMLFASTARAEGINCSELAQWSNTNPQVNLHHIFCGEINKKGNAVGYHANPEGNKPSTYRARDEKKDDGPNSQGVKQWFSISLNIAGVTKVKGMSSIFPDHCTQTQVVNSIVYASENNTGSCSDSSWAVCGPSAPTNKDSSYCIGADKTLLTIATSPKQNNRINTGFPLFFQN
ncbi:hypothetical protein TDB9533_03819 [Thalassocella blandensis]|nr:hypothetical protein TDB9533_03819 [Thalassocella blandensis]